MFLHYDQRKRLKFLELKNFRVIIINSPLTTIIFNGSEQYLELVVSEPLICPQWPFGGA